MPSHEDVSTTCTASHLVNWDIPKLADPNPKENVNARLRTVNSLISGGLKQDFAMIFVTTTEEQVKRCALDDFLPKIGFDRVFTGHKVSGRGQRHMETGDISMWCVEPTTYAEKLKSYKAELEAIKEQIDPPKKPDPARQKFPELRLVDLRKAGLIYPNSSVDNPLYQIINKENGSNEDKIYMFIQMQFGFDIKKWRNYGEGWNKLTIRAIKQAHVDWKAELV